ncbi:alpha/beta fold hydrolase [Gelidibacter gilvus]|uniref:Alpha/beta hydrolase n=1 Tax=Gelidibacter gilvus TaxID=59602 RepID=A0A4Q0XBD1_9FLAO|nr:alpha/beta hydrolase [Gelidibacter gilvus]RXJ44371.1 alpha/beta hydrolase [Gelidibacter gilvus]
MAIESNHKVLVFIHYFGGSAKSWEWVINRLDKKYHCIAINLPGFGNTIPLEEPSIVNFAEFVQQELKNSEISNYILIGHSMGAKIALQMTANDIKGNIERLILIAPSPPGIEPISEEEKRRMLIHPDLTEAKKTVDNITKIPLSDVQYDLAVDNNIMVENKTWEWWLESGMNESIIASVKQIKVPITIINSKNDPVMTPKIIKERFLNILPSANVISHHKLGHLIPMEDPEWLAEQIINICD